MAGMVKRADFLENEVVDLTEEIKLVSPTDTPLTTLLMGRGQVVPANDITVTWREKELNSDRGTLKLEGAEAGDVITSSRKTLSKKYGTTVDTLVKLNGIKNKNLINIGQVIKLP